MESVAKPARTFVDRSGRASYIWALSLIALGMFLYFLADFSKTRTCNHFGPDDVIWRTVSKSIIVFLMVGSGLYYLFSLGDRHVTVDTAALRLVVERLHGGPYGWLGRDVSIHSMRTFAGADLQYGTGKAYKRSHIVLKFFKSEAGCIEAYAQLSSGISSSAALSATTLVKSAGAGASGLLARFISSWLPTKPPAPPFRIADADSNSDHHTAASIQDEGLDTVSLDQCGHYCERTAVITFVRELNAYWNTVWPVLLARAIAQHRTDRGSKQNAPT